MLVFSASAKLPSSRHSPANTAADGSAKIEHWVVIMLENRAFDHILG